MRRRLIVLGAAVATSLALTAAPALAHPVQPPGHDGATVAFAGGSTPAHTLGLACAEDRSPAIGFLPLECVLGP
jgi:hypothetical protein